MNIMINVINMKIEKIRTVSVNEGGQIVIPEDIRKDLGIEKLSYSENRGAVQSKPLTYEIF